MKIIPLTQGYEAIVDDEDYVWAASLFPWCVSKSSNKRYASKRQNKKIVYLHRLLMNAPAGVEVDHINGNGLDNRRENLRLCSHADNQRAKKPQRGGTSPYRGVYWYKRHQKWATKIQRLDDVYFLGYFSEEEDAARAWDKKAKELFGDFAYQNFP